MLQPDVKASHIHQLEWKKIWVDLANHGISWS